MMDWSTLIQTLLAAATGAAMALGSAYLLEWRREARARAIELRTAYSRWLATHSTLTLNLELLSQLTDTLADDDEGILELISAHLNEARPDLRAMAELGYSVQFLERTEVIRRLVASTSEAAIKFFVFASSFAHALRSHARLREKISQLELTLAGLPPDDPSKVALSSKLKALREESSPRLKDQRSGLHERLLELVKVNQGLTRKAQEVVQKIGIHD
jgi:hypothetical protein